MAKHKAEEKKAPIPAQEAADLITEVMQKKTPELAAAYVTMARDAGAAECVERLRDALQVGAAALNLAQCAAAGDPKAVIPAVASLRHVSDATTAAEKTLSTLASYVYRSALCGHTISGLPRLVRPGKTEYETPSIPDDLSRALTAAKSQYAVALSESETVTRAAEKIALAEKRIKEWLETQKKRPTATPTRLSYELFSG